MVNISRNTGIIEILEKIRACPGMYIGRASISDLFIFLEGYKTARWELDIEPTEAEMDFYEHFHDFLQKRYKLRTSNSWANIILFHCGDEKEAFASFFKHLDEFMSRDKNQPLTEEKVLKSYLVSSGAIDENTDSREKRSDELMKANNAAILASCEPLSTEPDRES
jgi:hypothetical protein